MLKALRLGKLKFIVAVNNHCVTTAKTYLSILLLVDFASILFLMDFWVIFALWVSSVLLHKHCSMSMTVPASEWTFATFGYVPRIGTAGVEGTVILSYVS